MRTRPAHIQPDCPYCDEDHNPDIQCRCQPESVRFQLRGPRKPMERVSELIRDEQGKVVAVKHVYRETQP